MFSESDVKESKMADWQFDRFAPKRYSRCLAFLFVHCRTSVDDHNIFISYNIFGWHRGHELWQLSQAIKRTNPP